MSMVSFSSVNDPQARLFLAAFFQNRRINHDFFRLVPEKKYDFRMVDTPGRKSDSPRESLAHQINVQRAYMIAVTRGKLSFGAGRDPSLKSQTKKFLLAALARADRELVNLLTEPENITRRIIVPWNHQGINAIDMLWSLNSHEILHTGWNLAIMDHLNLPRFPALRKMWG